MYPGLLAMKRLAVAAFVSVAAALAACSAQKSSNPLTPTVAGPIPGVNISTPNPVSPRSARVTVDEQPVTLVFDNAASNGPRPLSYSVEVATDANFATKVFTRTGVAPGSGRTSLRLPDRLAPERSYFWRARAEDGANTGDYSTAASFEVYTPKIIREPVPQAPINNVTVDSLRPTFVFANAFHSGPLGPISYVVEVALDYGFSETYTIGPVPEGAGQTTVQAPQNGNYSSYYFWRVRAQDPTTVGPWSAPQAFSTPAKPAPAPPPGGGGGGGGGGNANGCHVGTDQSEDSARRIVMGCASEFPNLLGVFPTDQQATDADEQFLLRVIWHLQLQGFQAARQKNPSGLISNDKLCIVINGAWHSYDIMSMGFAGHSTTVTFNEVTPPNPQPNPGIPD
jgi:hypothetical protein